MWFYSVVFIMYFIHFTAQYCDTSESGVIGLLGHRLSSHPLYPGNEWFESNKND